MPRIKFQFGVVSGDGRRASQWTLLVINKANGEGDVYLFARNLGGTIKTSFHNTGQCHTAFEPRYFESLDEGKFHPPPTSRYLEKWMAESNPENGVAIAYNIITLPETVRTDASDLPEGFLRIPPPRPENVRLTSLFFINRGRTATVRGEGLLRVCDVKLNDGRALVVFSSEIPRPQIPEVKLAAEMSKEAFEKIANSDSLIMIGHTDFDGWGRRVKTIVEMPAQYEFIPQADRDIGDR